MFNSYLEKYGSLSILKMDEHIESILAEMPDSFAIRNILDEPFSDSVKRRL